VACRSGRWVTAARRRHLWARAAVVGLPVPPPGRCAAAAGPVWYRRPRLVLAGLGWFWSPAGSGGPAWSWRAAVAWHRSVITMRARAQRPRQDPALRL